MCICVCICASSRIENHSSMDSNQLLDFSTPIPHLSPPMTKPMIPTLFQLLNTARLPNISYSYPPQTNISSLAHQPYNHIPLHPSLT